MFRKLIERIFPKKKEEVEIEKEIEEIPEVVQKAKLQVRIENLTGIADVDRIARFIKDGDVLFLKVKELRRRDLGQFQNTLQKMKRLSVQFGWNIAATEEGYVIATPSNIKIEK
ncbi:MAG: cell division protein SepF [Candidatus Aenigmarchaeota archaeon]|nr:cell division protein SepF [Candidatus Aenigmarchaeota archaeon]